MWLSETDGRARPPRQAASRMPIRWIRCTIFVTRPHGSDGASERASEVSVSLRQGAAAAGHEPFFAFAFPFRSSLTEIRSDQTERSACFVRSHGRVPTGLARARRRGNGPHVFLARGPRTDHGARSRLRPLGPCPAQDKVHQAPFANLCLFVFPFCLGPVPAKRVYDTMWGR